VTGSLRAADSADARDAETHSRTFADGRRGEGTRLVDVARPWGSAHGYRSLTVAALLRGWMRIERAGRRIPPTHETEKTDALARGCTLVGVTMNCVKRDVMQGEVQLPTH
jgi:hypothetical protein